jgi:hypothetical protein
MERFFNAEKFVLDNFSSDQKSFGIQMENKKSY